MAYHLITAWQQAFLTQISPSIFHNVLHDNGSTCGLFLFAFGVLFLASNPQGKWLLTLTRPGGLQVQVQAE
jgi:hypothetical protein